MPGFRSWTHKLACDAVELMLWKVHWKNTLKSIVQCTARRWTGWNGRRTSGRITQGCSPDAPKGHSFTGYSAICMALGLPEGGHIDTLEINDELEDLICEGFERAGVAGKISLHIGDALEFMRAQQGKVSYDMVFIDANKREYPEYFESALALTRTGGFILADDVLWDGKVYADNVPGDKQTSGIVRFNDMAAGDPRVETVMLPIRHGLGIIRKK